MGKEHCILLKTSRFLGSPCRSSQTLTGRWYILLTFCYGSLFRAVLYLTACVSHKLKTACIREHVYFLNFIAIYQMWTIGNTRSVIKEADHQKWRFTTHPKIEVSECYSKSWKCPNQFNYQQQQLSVACAWPTWCNHSLAMASYASLGGCHFKIVPLQTLCRP